GGRRRTVPQERISLVRDAVERSIEKCSPGVILRTLIQDDVFSPIAVVLGPGEVAYRAQISDVYQALAIPRPSVVPRMSATYIPPPAASLFTGGDDCDTLLNDPARFVAALYEESVPADMHLAVKRYQDIVTSATDDVAQAMSAAIPDKLRKRLAGRLADIRNRLEQIGDIEKEAGKRTALERHPFLAGIASAVRPDNKPQERVLSCLTPFLFAGDRASFALQEAARRYIDELMDGHARHIVYSA
ncbi:MAG: bacillithiol biosynthesis BshC, partial [Candidatus Latescibacterota bacterium]